MSIESVIPSNHLILCCLLFLLPSIFPSIRIFSNESILCIRWPKYWSFSFNIRNSGLISFRMDWFDLLAVQGTFKSLLQQHSSKAQVLQCSIFFTSVHGYWTNHSFDYMDLCQQSNVSAFYMLSSFIIAFLPRSKCLLNSWLQSESTVILEPKKIKSVTVSIVSLSICREMMELDTKIFAFWMLSFKLAWLSH